MAGSMVTVPINHLEMENPKHSHSQISPIIDQWQIQYARFINCSSSNVSRTRSSLSPLAAVQKQRLRGGTWISSSSFTACLKLVSDHSNGFSDAILLLSLRAKVLVSPKSDRVFVQEEHYISKLQFSWPQVSCVSGFPSRGSRAVFVSYKDGVGQIQKFAIRFLSSFEAENFMNVLKEILDSASQGLPCDSDLSYQDESVRSIGPAYRPEENWQYTTSADTSIHLIPPIDEAQDSNPQESSQNVADEELLPAFPPSFTSLLMNHCPAANKAKPAETEEVDLKTQIMQYLEGSSFKDIVDTVENVIKELGDDILL
ncbi:unnamed protein product [Fraxinus pennsylvanica]|uniref:Poor homologous synapsis 1 PH domain-containing protein n=1 Tax=Fraxinus pennsylvanica TaxID=56036 RepID=A0AAD2E9C0_9LAMI|nr:unnamed protein product [Fraxinus pennsylvanica]